jgi:hypothetical protein
MMLQLLFSGFFQYNAKTDGPQRKNQLTFSRNTRKDSNTLGNILVNSCRTVQGRFILGNTEKSSLRIHPGQIQHCPVQAAPSAVG